MARAASPLEDRMKSPLGDPVVIVIERMDVETAPDIHGIGCWSFLGVA